MNAPQKANRPGVQAWAAVRSIDLGGSERQYSYIDCGNPFTEVFSLYAQGFSLVPLGGGADGKSRLVRFANRERLPLELLVNKMVAAGSRVFGVKLPGMLVIDVDSDTPEAQEFVRVNFGESPMQVQTPRGRHHYFRFRGQTNPQRIRLPDIAIDFKSGQNAYVVGPGSVRPDGGSYQALGVHLADASALPDFVDRRAALSSGNERTHDRKGGVGVGDRNRYLFDLALEYSRIATDIEEVRENLLQIRTIHFDHPQSFPDSEVAKIVDTVWSYRMEGRLFGGKNSVVPLRHDIVDEMLAIDHGCDALGLYTLLLKNHGHIPGKRFAIVAESIRKAGLLKLSRNKILNAIELLVSKGYLIKGKKAGFGGPVQYQLTSGRRVGGTPGEGVYYIESHGGTNGG